MILVCNIQIGQEKTTKLLSDIWDSVEEREYPEQIRQLILEPVLVQLQIEMRDICTDDCRRIITDKIELNKDEIEEYWKRVSIDETTKDNEKGDRILTIESREESCKVGFSLDKEHGCPLCNIENPHKDILSFLSVVKKVSDFRRNEKKDV